MKVIAATTSTISGMSSTTAFAPDTAEVANGHSNRINIYNRDDSHDDSDPSSTLGPMRISLHMARAEPLLPTDTSTAISSSSTIASPRNPPTSAGRSFQFSHPYRFHDPKTGVQTAFLETTGRLHVKDGAGSLEIWEHARYFMVDCMRQNPGKSPDELLRQLAGIFGPPQKVVPKGEVDYTQARPRNKPSSSLSSSVSTGSSGLLSTNQPLSDADADAVLSSDSGENEYMGKVNKTAAKASGGSTKVRMLGAPKSKGTGGATPTRHKSATRKADASPSGPPKDCGCGCGQQCGSPKSTFLPGHDARFHGWIKKYIKGVMKMGEFNETVQRYIRREGIKVEKE